MLRYFGGFWRAAIGQKFLKFYVARAVGPACSETCILGAKSALAV